MDYYKVLGLHLLYMKSSLKCKQIIQDAQIVPIEKPKSWRLIMTKEAAAEIEEVVFSFQGVIVQKNLPPFMHTV
jgi:hypothetical protein